MWPYAIKGEIALSLYIPLHYTLTLNDEHTDAKGRNTNACDNFPYLNGRLASLQRPFGTDCEVLWKNILRDGVNHFIY